MCFFFCFSNLRHFFFTAPKGNKPQVQEVTKSRELIQRLEEKLIKYFVLMSKIGRVIQKEEIHVILRGALDNFEIENGVALNNGLNFQWIHEFVDRHLDEHKNKTNEEGIRHWFDKLEKFLLEEHDIVAGELFTKENSNRIFNCDNICFPLGGNGNSSLKKIIPETNLDLKEQITVLWCVNASGNFFKPTIIYPGTKSSIQLEESNNKTYFSVHAQNGWISTDNFYEWVSKCFYKEIENKTQFPVLLFLNGHSTCVNVAAADFCMKHNIILFCFPPLSSNTMKPLDFCIYNVLFDHWNDTIQKFTKEFNIDISRTSFYTVFEKAWTSAISEPQNIIEGFKKAGIIPFDPSVLGCHNNENKDNLEVSNISNDINMDERMGIIRMMNAFEESLSDEIRTLFEKRWLVKYEVFDDSAMNQFWRTYKTLRNIYEAEGCSNIQYENKFHPEVQIVADD